MSLVHVPSSGRACGRELFRRAPALRVVIDAVLGGDVGELMVDREDSPRVGCVRLGVYAILSGDRSVPEARELVAAQRLPCEFVLGGDEEWTHLVRETYGDRAVSRVMRNFDASGVARDRLESGVAGVARGYEVREMRVADCALLGSELSPNDPSVFGSAERFLSEGFGVVVCCDDAIAAAASTYAVSKTEAEIAIATHPDHRKKGLAVAVGSAMILECLRRSLKPRWTAGNAISEKTAARIGLLPGAEIPIEYVSG